MKTIKLNLTPLWLILAGFLIGILTAFLIQRPADTTELKLLISNLKKSISQESQEAVKLVNRNKAISDSLESLNAKYTDLLSKTITDSQVDSLQKKEIVKGEARYGTPSFSNSQAAVASSFGNQAFDELEILDDRVLVQTKVIGITNGIVVKQDSIIKTQVDIIKAVEKKATKRNLGSFLKGFGGGGLTVLLLVLLL